MIKTQLSTCGKYLPVALLIILFNLSLKSQDEISIIDAELLKNNLDELAVSLRIPGYSVFLGQEDNIFWTGSFGYADLINDIKSQDHTCYQCASLTKPITAAVLLKMVYEDKISLDDIVLPYVLPILQKYGIPIDESVGEIKVKHLVSHTSDAPPGTYFRYNGDRYSLLQFPVTDISGSSLEDIFLREICKPLSLNYTVPCTMLDSFPLINEKLAAPYTLNEELVLEKGSYTKGFSASAGLISNVTDLARFTSAFFNGQIVPIDLVEMATEPFELKSGAKTAYGLGWHVEELFGWKTYWHAGYGYSTSGLIMYIPDFDLSFIMLSNSNLLSRPFPNGLPHMSLLESPFALEVFRMLLNKELSNDKLPILDWDVQTQEQIIRTYAAAGQIAKQFIRMELKGKWNISRLLNDPENQDKLLSIYRRLEHQNGTKGNPLTEPLVQIHVNRKGHFRDTLVMADKGILNIHALADGGYCEYFGMYDHVWIEHVSGELVWEMNASHTEYAGGHPRNRKASLQLILPEGIYVVHYNNLDSPYNHYYGHWEAFPPDEDLWGISLSKKESEE